MADTTPSTLAGTYDLVAEEYARRLTRELEGKPFDRLMLDQFAEKVGDGAVADVGCGPGHVGRYLHDAGATGVFGLDVSPGMVATAQALNPSMRFSVGDMTAMEHENASLDGVLSFYSIVHTPTHKLARPLLEWARVTRLGGWLLLAFHHGSDPATRKVTRQMSEWWGYDVDVTFTFHPRGGVAAILRQTGWKVFDSMERPPYGEDVEYPSRRAYILAQRKDMPQPLSRR